MNNVKFNYRRIIIGLIIIVGLLAGITTSAYATDESETQTTVSPAVTFTVTFNKSKTTGKKTYTIKENGNLKSVPNAKSVGHHYTFLGWKATGTSKILSAKTIKSTPVNKKVTYNAVYRDNWALTKTHVKYISPNSKGKFYPTRKLTKGAAAAMVYNLLQEKSGSKKYCKDVKASTANGKAIGRLMYLGIISPNKSGRYYPNKAISKKELMAMIYKCKDKTNPYKSSSTVTKGEAVKMINSAIGRGKTDTATIKKGTKIRSFTDVTTGYKYYSAIMEASIEHVYKRTSSNSEKWTSYTRESQGIKGTGWKIIDGETYYISSTTKVITRNKTVQNHKLNSNGRYTTGSSKLDRELKKVILRKTTDNMSNSKRLKICYKYVFSTCDYRTDSLIKLGSGSWDKNLAYKMLRNKKGNCYYYAAAFTYLAKKCGYNAKTISGIVATGGGGTRHGWTEFKMADGTKRVSDPEIEYYRGNNNCNYYMRKYTSTYKNIHTYYYAQGKLAR